VPPRPLRFDPIAEARRQWIDHGWDDAADGMAAITSVVRAEQLFRTRIDALLAPFELSFARFEVLTLLSFTREGRLPLGKIGVRLQVHPASVTNAVDRLEAQGFVTREAHPSDRRATLAVLTPAGRKVARRAGQVLNDQVFALVPLSDRELRQLFTLLRKLRAAAGDFDE
jgi:DNA-binding MarR family transcriptional regulator